MDKELESFEAADMNEVVRLRKIEKTAEDVIKHWELYGVGMIFSKLVALQATLPQNKE